MKIVYRNRAMNRQSNSTPSVKTLILVGCLVIMMVAIKVAYDPNDSAEEMSVMASMTDRLQAVETEEDGADEKVSEE